MPGPERTGSLPGRGLAVVEPGVVAPAIRPRHMPRSARSSRSAIHTGLPVLGLLLMRIYHILRFSLTRDLQSVRVQRGSASTQRKHLVTERKPYAWDGWFTCHGSPASGSVLSAYPVDRILQSRNPPGGAPGPMKAGFSQPWPATATPPTPLGNTHPTTSLRLNIDPPPLGDRKAAGTGPHKEPPLLWTVLPTLLNSPGGGFHGGAKIVVSGCL